MTEQLRRKGLLLYRRTTLSQNSLLVLEYVYFNINYLDGKDFNLVYINLGG